jgi:hypothetical protein
MSNNKVYPSEVIMAQDKKWTRTIQFTEEQQSVIAEIVLFVNDLGVPDHIDETVFDEVLEVVCDDSPFEWSVS